MKIKVIINPVSGGSASNKLHNTIKEALKDSDFEYNIEHTTIDRKADAITREALKNGFEKIIAVGGDGTLSETVNGFFENDKPINKNAVFSFIMTGRGNDFRKTFGIKNNISIAIHRALNGKVNPIDLIRVDYVNHTGRQDSRYCLNLASFGMSGEVDMAVNKSSLADIIGGTGAFLVNSLKTLLDYENKQVKMTIDDREINQKVRVAVIANGQYAGGGMWFAPEAKVNDGKLEVIIMGDMSKLDSFLNTASVYDGTYVNHEKVTSYKAEKITAESINDEPVYLDLDGEAPGKLPATFQVLKNQILLCI